MNSYIDRLLIEWADAIARERDPLGYPHRTTEARIAAGEVPGGMPPGPIIPLNIMAPNVRKIDAGIRRMNRRHRNAIKLRYVERGTEKEQVAAWRKDTGRGRSCYMAALAEAQWYLAGRLSR
jgi:hypothetical protein